MLRSLFIATALLLTATLAAPQIASAQNLKKGATPVGVVSQATARVVIAALRAEGVTELESAIDSYGDPQVNARHLGLNFSVRFYKCDGDGELACGQLQYRISFDLDYDPDEAARLMQGWNREWVFGKAYTNGDGDMILEHAVYLAGGVSPENLLVTTELWLEIMTDFADHIGWSWDGAGPGADLPEPAPRPRIGGA